ncbi:MAG: chemotaxis protein CheX [Lysobacterales bacterium]
MKEEDLKVFIEGVTHYFDQMSESPASVETPFLQENNTTMAHEYTGIIGISGRKRGCVYFTTPGKLLRHLLLAIGEEDTSEEAVCDLVGEVANTIAGNARRYFGSEFMISVPVVVDGAPERIKLPQSVRSFVIPVTWRGYESAVVICLE